MVLFPAICVWPGFFFLNLEAFKGFSFIPIVLKYLIDNPGCEFLFIRCTHSV